MDCSPSGSSVRGILQARILEWVAYPPPGDLPDPGIDLASLRSAALAGGLFTASAVVHVNWLQIQGQAVSVTWKGEMLSPHLCYL